MINVHWKDNGDIETRRWQRCRYNWQMRGHQFLNQSRNLEPRNFPKKWHFCSQILLPALFRHWESLQSLCQWRKRIFWRNLESKKWFFLQFLQVGVEGYLRPVLDDQESFMKMSYNIWFCPYNVQINLERGLNLKLTNYLQLFSKRKNWFSNILLMQMTYDFQQIFWL